MRWEKLNDDFWLDFDELGCITVDHVITLDERDKKIDIYRAVGITKMGQRIPVPLFESDKYADVDEWLVNLLLKK